MDVGCARRPAEVEERWSDQGWLVSGPAGSEGWSLRVFETVFEECGLEAVAEMAETMESGTINTSRCW